MSEAARANILRRLSSGAQPPTAVPSTQADSRGRLSSTGYDRVSRLRQMMEAVKTEFLEADQANWPTVVRTFLTREGVQTLLCGRDIDAAKIGESPRLVAYDKPIEEWKSELFGSIDASLTTTRGGIAETGTLILWPSPAEPRLMSLVPPIHIALLDTTKIYDTFAEAIRAESWAGNMPPNALLISGPSKTADIEQTLAYGVHGPKRLVVVLLNS